MSVEQLLSFFVCVCGSDKVDIHTTNLIYFIVLNFGENELLLDTGGVIASAVEGVAG